MERRKLKQIFFAIIACITITTVAVPVSTARAARANSYKSNQLNLAVKSAIAIDSQTGQILYSKKADKKLPIASMTKLITIYLTLNAIKQKKINWDTEIEPTKAIVKVANNPDYSNVPLKLHHKYTVKQLYQATLIESANGAAMCLAQKIGGSQEKFVDQMRVQVKKWGIKDANLYTSCGLPNGNLGTAAYPNVAKKKENQMSARDMAIIGQKLLSAYPAILDTTKVAHLNFNDQGSITKMSNFNWMLKGMSQYRANLPVDGLKTGTTDAAGACFIGTVKRQGARIITVVMGARHQDGTDPARFIQTAHLMNWIFQNYVPVTFTKGETLTDAKTIHVKDGQNFDTPIGIQKRTFVWDPVDGSKLKVDLAQNTVNAPLKEGAKAADYVFKSGKEKLISIDNEDGMEVPAQALKNNGEVNIFVKFWRWITGTK